MSAQASTVVLDVTPADFDAKVLRAHGLVVVDFWAPWCIWCKRLAPTLDELARSTSDVAFVKVDVEAHPDLGARFGISSLPTLKFFCGGREVGDLVGALPRPRLEAAIRDVVAAHGECLASSSPVKG